MSMIRHPAFGLALLAFTAAPGAALAAECTLTQITSLDMLMPNDRQALVPIAINNVPKLLLLDTGGYTSQIAPEVAHDLGLVLNRAGGELLDASGNISQSFVIVDSLKLGPLNATNAHIMVSPSSYGIADGLLSMDMLVRYDIEMDFGAGKLNYFSQDHCPGKVVYWNPAAVSAVPMRIRNRTRIEIDVTLDDHPFKAVLDTGASRSTISLAMAHGVFGLDPSSPGVAPAGNVNGDAKLAGYKYTFKTLGFEGVGVANPTLLLIPDRVTSQLPELGSRIPSSDAGLPELLLGMDILRHLHLFLSFKEGIMYVSGATTPPAQDAATGQSHVLDVMDKVLALSPRNTGMLNDRCWERALTNVKLEGALADCELALSIRHDNAGMLDSRGVALYRLGRYKDALDSYNRALALQSDLATSLYMRGQVKKKLGDDAGGDADVAAAKKQDSEILAVFKDTGLAQP